MRTIRNKSAPSAVTASVGDREVPVLLIGERRFVKVEDVAQALGTPAHHVIRQVPEARAAHDSVAFPPTRAAILAAEACGSPARVNDAYRAQRSLVMAPPARALEYVRRCAAELQRPLLSHQEEACALALARTAFYNAAEQGLGKTAAAWFTARLWGVRSLLVVCPKSLAGQWAEEQSAMWGFAPWFVVSASEGPVPRRARALSAIRTSRRFVVIANYEALSGLATTLLGVRFDAVVFDEAWRLKNRRAQVTRAAFVVADSIPRRWHWPGSTRDLSSWVPTTPRSPTGRSCSGWRSSG